MQAKLGRTQYLQLLPQLEEAEEGVQMESQL